MKTLAAIMVFFWFCSGANAAPLGGWWRGTLRPVESSCSHSSWRDPYDLNLRVRVGECDYYDDVMDWCPLAAKDGRFRWGGGWAAGEGASLGVSLKYSPSGSGLIYTYYYTWSWKHNFSTRYQVAEMLAEVYVDHSKVCAVKYRGPMRYSRRRKP